MSGYRVRRVGRATEVMVDVLERVMRYIREVLFEARKIVWLTRRQTLIYSVVVIVTVAVIAGFMYGVDGILNLISHGITAIA